MQKQPISCFTKMILNRSGEKQILKFQCDDDKYDYNSLFIDFTVSENQEVI